ncbi:Gfo/Idh/MocA family protein [Solicola sp. PLA-1-18]|uniref:Gfo/Idh/MocA family protein n=1 Tax=Solicola sp. PLA-1-18 TaxID=3380532 RepID=UPI003B825972
MTTPDLRIAVLGVGQMGGYHVDTLTARTKGARVTVVSDYSHERATEVASAVGARVVDDPLEAVTADDVDAVVIASPGQFHEAQVLACLEAGKPVLCEKPLTIEAGTAYDVVLAEAKLDRPLVQVGFMRRFDAEYLALRETIASEELGSALVLHCAHRNPAVPEHFDSTMMLTDSVVHEVDSARFLLDEEIVAVRVFAGVATSAAPSGVQDPMLVVFETEGGRLVTDEIFVRTTHAYEVRTELVAERGSAMIGLGHALQTSAGGRWGGQVTPDFVARFGQAYADELQAWVDGARRGEVAGPGAWDGYAAAAVTEAAVEALRTGERVEVRMGLRP